jgi:peptidoglycan/xylan/chitin deacetylase (PgdA/CDA1 family)
LTGGAAVLGSAMLFGATSAGLGIPLAALLAVIADGVFRPSSGTFYPTITHGPREARKVAITFDDGPDPEVTPLILDALAKYGARATFFMIGRHLARSPAIAERAVREGHEIGNHSWQHAYLPNLFSTRAALADTERVEELIRSLTKRGGPIPYRPPVGLKSPELARAAHARQLELIAWSVHSRDTLDSDPQRIARRVLARIRPGDIVLMHDGHQNSMTHRHAGAQALPLILAGLRELDLEAVTVQELLSGPPLD